ncbi:MAG: hypothetical protein ACJ75B_03235 [Flavisolibacter sp.]
MWRKILAYFLFGLGFFAVIYFRRYSGQVIPYPYFFYIIGLVIILGGVLLLRSTTRTSAMHLLHQIERTIKDLKRKGERIEVKLYQCEIKEHTYTEEKQPVDEEELKGLDLEKFRL